MAALKANLAKIPKVLTDPAPDIEILISCPSRSGGASVLQQRTPLAGVLYFDAQGAIRDTGANAGLPAREKHFMLRIAAAAN